MSFQGHPGDVDVLKLHILTDVALPLLFC